jgi:esterase/lipase superfamily enzyme
VSGSNQNSLDNDEVYSSTSTYLSRISSDLRVTQLRMGKRDISVLFCGGQHKDK